MSAPLVALERATYRYPRASADACAVLDLEVAEGEWLLVVGPSGAGKSTVLRMMNGLVPHFYGGTLFGRVTVAGRDTATTPPRDLADVVGFVAQDPESAAVTGRVEDEIAFTMENLGLPERETRKRVEEVLDALDLARLRDRRLETLSGGERQRVAIASAMAAQPSLLVLDEPTSQLDPSSAEDVIAAVQRLHHDLGIAVVMSEHRLERVAASADRVLALDPARCGDARTVFATGGPGTPLMRVAARLGWEPLPLTVREARRFAPGPRPGQRDARSAEPGSPGDVVAEARGVRVALGGAEVLAGIDLDVRRGETVALMGRNGSGKTTLARTMLGLVRPSGGRVRIAGRDPARAGVERVAGYLPQHAGSVLFRDTVAEEVAYTLAGRGATGSPLAALGLAAHAERDPRDLSAGLRLRAALAAVVAGDPPLLVLDEPTRGVDEEGKSLLVSLLRERRARGLANLVITHDVELAARCASRVVLLAGGAVAVEGPAREVLGGSMLFSTQINKVFGGDVLTYEDALVAAGAPDA